MGFQEQQGGGLEYLEFGPLQAGAPRQIVVLLHGYGRDARLMQKMAQDVAQRLPHALVLMPQAPDFLDVPESDDGNALRFPEQLKSDDQTDGRRQWFSIRAATLDDMRAAMIWASHQVDAFIDFHRDAQGLEDKDVALMGFSQGGSVALYAAYLRPQPLACVVAHSAVFPGGTGLRSASPTLFLYGRDDEEFSQAQFKAWSKAVSAHAPQTTVTEVSGLRHTTSPESRAIVADFIAARLG